MSYDDIRKLDRNGLEYLSLICITNNSKVFAGDKIMIRIVKELDAMQKNFDELIYYDPKKFHEAELKELAIEKNNLAIAKKLIEKGSTKDFVIEITDITENQYEDLVKEIQKETTNQ